MPLIGFAAPLPAHQGHGGSSSGPVVLIVVVVAMLLVAGYWFISSRSKR